MTDQASPTGSGTPSNYIKSVSAPILARRGPTLTADKSRVLLRRLYTGSHEKARAVVERVLSLPDDVADAELKAIEDEWGNRHKDLMHTLRHRYREVCANLNIRPERPDYVKNLIGAYFMHEYSIESAALFNPSIVPHPDQSGLPEGATRVIVSFRATGEGHISSVSFREGIVGRFNRISLVPCEPTITEAKRNPEELINKQHFESQVKNTRGVSGGFSKEHEVFEQAILDKLPETFSVDQLRRACSECLGECQSRASYHDETAQALLLLAEANYSVHFDPNTKISERILFPSAPSQSNGIEDARFVHFTNDDGSKIYYATFTAYNGRSAVPQLMRTHDFTSIEFVSMSGNAIVNKGMALFPRKINGEYWMLSRQDDENIMIMHTKDLLKWNDPEVLIRPEAPWEMFKMGNCGSPIETPKGWLILTHGVGPMRRYCIGAAMLDINDPTKVIGRMKQPLIAPNEAEREGYVPNVVYACGGMLHNKSEVILPYAMSDSQSSFASASLEDIYRAMGLVQEFSPRL